MSEIVGIVANKQAIEAITGTTENKQDIVGALENKQGIEGYTNTTGTTDYNKLRNRPTKLSQFENDVGYITTNELTSINTNIDELRQQVSENTSNIDTLQTQIGDINTVLDAINNEVV